MLPKPTINLVQQECNAFDQDPFTKLGEQALAQLREQFPRNIEASHILLKVLALNQLYSTRINYIDVDPLARHIAGLGIDTLLDQGSPRAVDLIFVCPPLPKYFSFATKFCSLHNPSAFPIYDHYVDECLWLYKKQDGFAVFHRQDLYIYERFVEIVTAFRNHYELSRFTFREIDKFLWRTGNSILRESTDPL
jgi:hypothetical protein